MTAKPRNSKTRARAEKADAPTAETPEQAILQDEGGKLQPDGGIRMPEGHTVYYDTATPGVDANLRSTADGQMLTSADDQAASAATDESPADEQ